MSDNYDLLIVGGGPAGLAGARAYRDSGGVGAVAIISDEERMPYSRPPLTKELLRGEMSVDELPLEDDAWLGEHSVSLIAGRAVALKSEPRRIVLSGGRTLGYRHCLIATGAEPVRPPIPGADDPAVRVVRSLDQMRALLARLKKGDPVLVVGSGFIGCEIAASLSMRGHPVSIVSAESTPNEERLGAQAGEQIAGWLRELHVTLALGAAAERIDRHDGELRLTAGARRLRAPVIVLATGVAPRSELLVPTDVTLEDGAVPVDSAMRTGLDGVLAAGDVAFADNALAGRPLRVEHWGDALGQGSVAGQTAAGADASWREVPGFWSTIGTRTLKYSAWGDGFDQLRFRQTDFGFTVSYGRRGKLVGVLTHRADEDYGRTREQIAQGAPWPH